MFCQKQFAIQWCFTEQSVSCQVKHNWATGFAKKMTISNYHFKKLEDFLQTGLKNLLKELNVEISWRFMVDILDISIILSKFFSSI